MKADKVLVDRINQQLNDKYGTDVITGLPIWRVVFSDDQTEKQYDEYEDYTPSGIYIRTVREVREIKKYPHVQALHILERLVQVPDYQQEQLAGAKISYELIFNFWNKNGEYLPPKWEVCEFVIETIYAAQYRTGNLRRYTDNSHTPQEKLKRINEIIDYIWGEDSAHRVGIKTGETVVGFHPVPEKVN